MEYFKFLPMEITLDILTRLPTETVLDCKLVCTNWRSLVRHPSFSKLHLHRLNHPSRADSGNLGFIAINSIKKNSDDSDSGKSGLFLLTEMENRAINYHYFEYKEDHESTIPVERIRKINLTSPFTATSFLGSINGLICLSRCPFSNEHRYQPVCICNPITKEYVMLPEIETDSGFDQSRYWTSGFGYVSSTSEYKVVVICMSKKTKSSLVHIYTLGSGSGWRNIGNCNFLFSTPCYQRGTFVDGALYWVDYELSMIVYFDLAKEKFCQNLSPPLLPPDSYIDNTSIGVLDGFLLISVFLDVEEGDNYEIWLLKKKNDNPDMKEQDVPQSLVWSREFGIDDGLPLAITKSGGVLIHMLDYLNIYDRKSATSKKIVDFQERFLPVFPHKNTLVSLKELGEADTKIMETGEIEKT